MSLLRILPVAFIFVSTISHASSFAKQFLASEILGAENKTHVNPKLRVVSNILVKEGAKLKDIKISLAALPLATQEKMKWIGFPKPFTLPECLDLVSLKCHILGEFRSGLDSGNLTEFTALMEQLDQRSHPILRDRDVGLIYASSLLRAQFYKRTLLTIFPMIKADPSLAVPYEWIQKLYGQAEKSDGKVAIKNP